MIKFSETFLKTIYQIFLIYWVQVVGIVTQLNQKSEIMQIVVAGLTLILICYFGQELVFYSGSEEEENAKKN